jgi:hypothetical protein
MAALNYTELRGRKCRIMWSQRDPNVRRAGVGNVFVKNLPPTVDSKALAEIFGVMRPVASAKVVTDGWDEAKDVIDAFIRENENRANGKCANQPPLSFKERHCCAKCQGNLPSGRTMMCSDT